MVKDSKIPVSIINKIEVTKNCIIVDTIQYESLLKYSMAIM